jgi:quercetin dioxygenase-like cupin family protein
MKFIPAVVGAIFSCAAMALSAPSAVELTAEPDHHLALENKYVRVFQVEVPPRAATLLHHHAHDYMFVTLGKSEIENDVEGKSPVTATIQDGEARFVPGDFSHVAKNLSDQPFRNVTIELLQDKQPHEEKWDEKRGVDILEGGTRDVLFVKDGARVSDIQLQPGASYPKHTHPGPYLLVAVTELHLRSEIPGRKPTDIDAKSGALSWVHDRTTHSVTNRGSQPARFILVEFQ